MILCMHVRRIVIGALRLFMELWVLYLYVAIWYHATFTQEFNSRAVIHTHVSYVIQFGQCVVLVCTCTDLVQTIPSKSASCRSDDYDIGTGYQYHRYSKLFV